MKIRVSVPGVRALPYLVPFVLFVTLPLLGNVIPPEGAPWLDPVRVALAGASLIFFASRAKYPELARAKPAGGASRPLALGVAVGAGLVCGLAWVPLAEAVPMIGGRGGFDPDAPGFAIRLALRLAGTLAVVPVMEELLVRSFVPRIVDSSGGGAPWHERSVGRFTVLSFAVSVAFFTLSHSEWLAALVTGIVYTALLMWTHRIRDAVIAHAVSNAVLAGWVITREEWHWW